MPTSLLASELVAIAHAFSNRVGSQHVTLSLEGLTREQWITLTRLSPLPYSRRQHVSDCPSPNEVGRRRGAWNALFRRPLPKPYWNLSIHTAFQSLFPK